MQKILWLTKRDDGILQIRNFLANRNIRLVCAPLFQIEIKPKIEILEDNVIISSPGGVEVSQKWELYEKNIISIGEYTTKRLQKHGFKKIKTAKGRASSIITILDPQKKYAHISGENSVLEYSKNIKKIKAYSTKPRLHCFGKNLFGVMIYSKATGQWLKEHDFKIENAWAISERVKIDIGCKWHIAEIPNPFGMKTKLVETIK